MATADRAAGSARVEVTRRVHFSAAHRLAGQRLAERDVAVFGDCARERHAHNYELNVTVEARWIVRRATSAI